MDVPPGDAARGNAHIYPVIRRVGYDRTRGGAVHLARPNFPKGFAILLHPSAPGGRTPALPLGAISVIWQGLERLPIRCTESASISFGGWGSRVTWTVRARENCYRCRLFR